ncbi:S-norcoclaurine synthase 1 [Heracleum sosnowskyi]|uniref:S-norcoclaurine synthase 1 n=1 Tax=Heracleum sosnowskyi TaxID=360622 RepID=A0AAD8MIU7_9APIA|nr:S-norcoclaurine synthase 1 [Heracleum sosnowskyi]
MVSSEGVASTAYGGSIPVENVQSLASENLIEIPPRYLREEYESDELLDDEALEIPVIDMNKFLIGQSEYKYELEKLHLACKDWGFFQMINHGALEEIEKMKAVTEEFFMLPLEEKMVCAQLPHSIEGYGQAFVHSDDQKLDWADMLFLLPRPSSTRNIEIWPKAPSSFRPTLEEYSAKLHKISINLLKLIAENLKVETESLIGKFDPDGTQGVRMNYYPPCVQANKVLGLTPHSDATGLTLLIQVNDVEGLQIKKTQKWVPIKPISGAIVVNIGDIMEVFSNGEYSSIEHRAVVNNKKERLSIAAFHSPKTDTYIGPLPELVQENYPKYKTIRHEDFIRLVVTSHLVGKSILDHLKCDQLQNTQS